MANSALKSVKHTTSPSANNNVAQPGIAQLETTEHQVGGPGPIDNRGNHNSPTVDDEKVKQYELKGLMETHSTKSAVIRFLSSQGLSRSEIVKVFTNGGDPIRYQHVRNVLITPVKVNRE